MVLFQKMEGKHLRILGTCTVMYMTSFFQIRIQIICFLEQMEECTEAGTEGLPAKL